MPCSIVYIQTNVGNIEMLERDEHTEHTTALTVRVRFITRGQHSSLQSAQCDWLQCNRPPEITAIKTSGSLQVSDSHWEP